MAEIKHTLQFELPIARSASLPPYPKSSKGIHHHQPFRARATSFSHIRSSFPSANRCLSLIEESECISSLCEAVHPTKISRYDAGSHINWTQPFLSRSLKSSCSRTSSSRYSRNSATNGSGLPFLPSHALDDADNELLLGHLAKVVDHSGAVVGIDGSSSFPAVDVTGVNPVPGAIALDYPPLAHMPASNLISQPRSLLSHAPIQLQDTTDILAQERASHPIFLTAKPKRTITPAYWTFWLGFICPFLWLLGGWHFTALGEQPSHLTAFEFYFNAGYWKEFFHVCSPKDRWHAQLPPFGSSYPLPTWILSRQSTSAGQSRLNDPKRSLRGITFAYPFISRDQTASWSGAAMKNLQNVLGLANRMLDCIPGVKAVDVQGKRETPRRIIDPWIQRCRYAFCYLIGIILLGMVASWAVVVYLFLE